MALTLSKRAAPVADESSVVPTLVSLREHPEYCQAQARLKELSAAVAEAHATAGISTAPRTQAAPLDPIDAALAVARGEEIEADKQVAAEELMRRTRMLQVGAEQARHAMEETRYRLTLEAADKLRDQHRAAAIEAGEAMLAAVAANRKIRALHDAMSTAGYMQALPPVLCNPEPGQGLFKRIDDAYGTTFEARYHELTAGRHPNQQRI